MRGEGRSLTLEFDVDDGVVLGLGIFINLHKLFCDKSVLSVCADASLHKILVRYANPVLVVDAVDECDTIYIKTQVFRLLRYYSPAPRNIARSDWTTQNITHNMTSPIT